jgi:hypothetical protein
VGVLKGIGGGLRERGTPNEQKNWRRKKERAGEQKTHRRGVGAIRHPRKNGPQQLSSPAKAKALDGVCEWFSEKHA